MLGASDVAPLARLTATAEDIRSAEAAQLLDELTAERMYQERR
jgi:hypothetical protein